jgi:hypothetical protein
MRLIINAITLLVIGLVCGSIAVLALNWPFFNLAQGELRCEGDGAVVIKVAGEDYAVNGLAAARYPPIQRIWNRGTYPETNIDRIIVRGLTLCDW